MRVIAAAAALAFLAGTAAAGDSPMLVNPCLNATFKGMPFCDYTKSVDDRVADLVGRLSLAEKIGALGTDTPAMPSVGDPGYNWWSEATHGISHVRNDASTPTETNFALPITTGGSFNRSLWRATGMQIGTEARAFMNLGNAYSTYWAPVINLVRDPRWGRNIETPGEDPYLSGQYAINFVKGMQNNPADPGHVQASACCKHYVANSMDHSTVDGVTHDRTDFNAVVTPQDLVDSYMAPFQDCVEQGQVTGLMCSYNELNGVPSCANGWMLETVARGEWEFDGYVTSDCDADANVFAPHHFASTKEQVVADVLHAGTDVDCGQFVQQNAQSALSKGLITEGDIDVRLAKLFRVRMRLGHYDPPGPLQQLTDAAVCTKDALALSRDGTVQSAVLLKNDKETLPLDASAPKSVAVIGPNIDLSKSIATYYGGAAVCEGKYWNATDAIANYVGWGKVFSTKGVPSVTSNDTSGVAAAAEAAKAADQVFMVVGNDGTVEHEGHDRSTVTLSDGQTTLIAAVADAAQKPIVVIILTGGAVDVSAMLANPKVGAVIHAGQPSVTVLGLGDLIFKQGGRVPAGRMIQTIYPAAFVDEVSIFDMNMRPGPSAWPAPGCTTPPNCKNGTNPGRTHRFYTGKAVLPFGYGLSYTTFKYSIGKAAPTTVNIDAARGLLADAAAAGRRFPRRVDATAPLVTYEVQVTNTGSVDADDVVLGFLTPPGAGTGGTPLQTLFGFERVHVKAGQTVTVYLGAGVEAFTTVKPDGSRAALAGEYKVHFGVAEAADKGMGYAEHVMVAV